MRHNWSRAGVGVLALALAGAALAQDPPPSPPADRLPVPAAFPGAKATPLELPRDDDPQKKKEALAKLYPPLPPLPEDPPPQPGPDGRPWALADVERTALANSPAVKQAAADVVAARGAAIQAGLCPNPTLGGVWDDINAGRTSGLIGAYVAQTIVTGGKLQLARAAALVEVENAELALRKSRVEVLTAARQNVVNVLVARESARQQAAVVEFFDAAYRLQLEQVTAGLVGAYAALPLRAQALQSRAAHAQSVARARAAWRQLAASLNLRDLPPTELQGVIENLPPAVDVAALRPRVLEGHTDVLSAVNSVRRAQIQVKLARAQVKPDVTIQLGVQQDNTQTPPGVTSTAQIALPVPLYNRNQGGRLQAEGQLARAAQEPERLRNELDGRLADAAARLAANRRLLETYRTRVLPDLVLTYRGIYARHQQDPEKVGLGDVLAAQVNLTDAITTYLGFLGGDWTAFVDLAALLQVEDLSQLCPAPAPEAEVLPAPMPAPEK